MRQTFTRHQAQADRSTGLFQVVDGKNWPMDVADAARDASKWYPILLRLPARRPGWLPECNPGSRLRCQPAACRIDFKSKRHGRVPAHAGVSVGPRRSKP